MSKNKDKQVSMKITVADFAHAILDAYERGCNKSTLDCLLLSGEEEQDVLSEPTPQEENIERFQELYVSGRDFSKPDTHTGTLRFQSKSITDTYDYADEDAVFKGIMYREPFPIVPQQED